ncbi:unnamed protein product, partial [Symbiodinium microadriaticum]
LPGQPVQPVRSSSEEATTREGEQEEVEEEESSSEGEASSLEEESSDDESLSRKRLWFKCFGSHFVHLRPATFLTPTLLILLRVLAASLCFPAVAQFTKDKLDDMASSIQTTADHLQHIVVALYHEIQPISVHMGTYR